jgi:hypothetical protein
MGVSNPFQDCLRLGSNSTEPYGLLPIGSRRDIVRPFCETVTVTLSTTVLGETVCGTTAGNGRGPEKMVLNWPPCG